jgi:ribosomal protein L37E
MPVIICKNCGKEVIAHSKDLCTTCYKKILWQPKLTVCKRCGRERPHHAKGFCAGCYQSVFRLDENKAWNYQKDHKISVEEYKELTKKCIICGFDKVVELHHLDENKKNNSKENLIGLCPNHHKMLHNFKFRKEILEALEKKGIVTKKDFRLKFIKT